MDFSQILADVEGALGAMDNPAWGQDIREVAAVAATALISLQQIAKMLHDQAAQPAPLSVADVDEAIRQHMAAAHPQAAPAAAGAGAMSGDIPHA